MTPSLSDWAREWGIPLAALIDLAHRLTIPVNPVVEGISEAAATSRMRLDAARHGIWLGRNNRGVAFNETGQPVRFGLGNESAEMNKSSKSSDYIGIRPPNGIFVAREVKRPGWRYSGTEEEEAQLNFLTFISIMGGDAAFTTGEGSF